ncbi:GH14940 [Drosophila grimshawi]|uniref:GH14940 n=1 Tax=Drosophila grimshawi TaxID=7222 RepID=B4J1M0_DROGR|nr:GH14940 [Drosophila grimshawi]
MKQAELSISNSISSKRGEVAAAVAVSVDVDRCSLTNYELGSFSQHQQQQQK